MVFTKKEIKTNTLGGLLKQARLSQNLKLEEVSKKTGIEVKYLESLEADDFYKLPGSTYTRGFLKRYAEFLKQDAEEMLEQWNQKYHKEKNFPTEKLEKESNPKKINFKIVLISAVILLILFYLGWNTKRVLFTPEIKLLYPSQDTVVEESSLVIQGKTSPRASVFINNQPVEKIDKGVFQQKINLLPGLNTIEISAKKRYSKEGIVYLQVVFEDKQNLIE